MRGYLRLDGRRRIIETQSWFSDWLIELMKAKCRLLPAHSSPSQEWPLKTVQRDTSPKWAKLKAALGNQLPIKGEVVELRIYMGLMGSDE